MSARNTTFYMEQFYLLQRKTQPISPMEFLYRLHKFSGSKYPHDPAELY